MPRSKRRPLDSEYNIWLGYTDLLSNSLFLLLLVLAVSAATSAYKIKLANTKGDNDTPPLVIFSEKNYFLFERGSFSLTHDFKHDLDQRLPQINAEIRKKSINVVEVIGHTDGQPISDQGNHTNYISNLDALLPNSNLTMNLTPFAPGSNIDLGLLRAWSVAQYLNTKLAKSGHKHLMFRLYSAGSLIASNGRFMPADASDQADRRRIELRLTRK
jgi:outer membrane protein OmpA-like peptidoglycan-associated protein